MKLLPETKLTQSAKASRWRHFWLIDLLIAMLLFLIAQQIESLILIPAVVVWMMSGIEISALTESGDMSQLFSAVSDLMAHQPDWMTLLQLILTVAVIVVCIVYCTKLERRPLTSLGFRGKNPVGEYLIGYVLGVLLFTLAWAICLATGTAKLEPMPSGLPWTIVLFLFAFLIQGLSEETLCRGFLMQTLSARYAPIVAVAVNAVFFAALHFANAGLTLLAFCNLFLFGIFASVYMWKRGSIWGVAALHSAWNFTQGNLLGIRVSGNVLGPSVLSTSLTENGAWINGGAFGLEGGLAVTIVLSLGILLMLFLPVRKSEAVH